MYITLAHIFYRKETEYARGKVVFFEKFWEFLRITEKEALLHQLFQYKCLPLQHDLVCGSMVMLPVHPNGFPGIHEFQCKFCFRFIII